MSPESLALARLGALAVLALPAAWIDARRGVIPDRLNAGAAGVGVLLAVLDPEWLTFVLAALVATGALLAARSLGHVIAGQPGMGMGDVKMAAPLGLLMGWSALWALYLAMVVGAVVGLAGRWAGRFERHQRIPFAPSIAVGVVLSFVLPFERVWGWVLSLYGL